MFALNTTATRFEMKSIVSQQTRLSQIFLGAAILSALFLAREAKADDEHQHVVTDWSHRHVVFSEPKTQAKRFQLSSNPRYAQQGMRRNAHRHWGRGEWRGLHAPEDPNHLNGDWSMSMGVGATVGAGNYPAKFSFNSNSANCETPAPPPGQQPDFVVYNTSLAGSSSQATIVAFDNIYASPTCTGGSPLTYWAYNTGAGAVVTSPVLSYDGAQVAFVQNIAGAATLVILRWKAHTGTLSIPVMPSSGACTTLTAPCQTIITFSTSNSDTTSQDSFSSPFYDYDHDVLYVGDDLGFLHKFTGVFLGTPTEVVCTATTGTTGCTLPFGTDLWPANLTAGFGHLNSPVFVSSPFNQVFVTSSDGVLYSADSTIGGIYPNGYNFLDPKLASTTLTNGFDDGPLVDVTTGNVYLFARASSEFVIPANGISNGVPGVASVFQVAIPASPSALHFATVVQAVVSNSATIPASAFYIGAFDDSYMSSTDGSGSFYVCSTSGAVNAIWRIPLASSVMGTPSLGPTLTTANVGCSPITEFNNTNTNIDRIFLSVSGSPVTSGTINCPSNSAGCIMSFRVDSSLTPTTPTSATAREAGGTSGIVVDNSSLASGASQIYFTPLADQVCTTSGGTGGCAIQASQSGLN
jgi:hypothetical protein